MIAEVGGVTMQNVVAGLSRTPGQLRHPGRPFNADTKAVLDRLGIKSGKNEEK
jgi:crotonobetainyl-CoA:carnitine CoA-transferase CaiB-like acyl-CoA transferase